MKVKLKTIEQIKEEAIKEGHDIKDNGYDITFSPYRGLITDKMMPFFGKEMEMEKINHPKYDYVAFMDNDGRRFIREEWIEHIPNFVKEISSIFDSILEDL